MDIERIVSDALLDAELPGIGIIEDALLLENGRGFSDLESYRDYLAGQTLCVTMLAGSGSRWVNSVEAAKAAGERVDFDTAKPRALFPVADAIHGSGSIAVGAYSIRALSGLGDPLVLVRGHEADISRDILARLGLDPLAFRFRTQETWNGSPLGHGDAAWQLADAISAYEYVVVNFGGDLSSPRTAFLALAALDALDSAGADVREIIPAAPMENPDYPIGLDSEGFPVSFGHAKLKGASDGVAKGLTNVGVRVFKTDALLDACEYFRSRYYSQEKGYSIPGNAGNEFALDNVDSFLAEKRTARILACASPLEAVKIKKWDDIPAFERAARELFPV